MRRRLYGALKTIKFQPDELAYLALTSKPEHHVRDRLAWELHKAGDVAAREWKRTDLAVFDKEHKPIALIEAKAMYSFEADTTGPYHGVHMPKYEVSIKRDLDKAATLARQEDAPGAEVFALLVVTHVSDPVPRELRGLIKYGTYLRRPADLKAAEQRIRKFLEPLGAVRRKRLVEGEAFELRAMVDAWLCGPVGAVSKRAVSAGAAGGAAGHDEARAHTRVKGSRALGD